MKIFKLFFLLLFLITAGINTTAQTPPIPFPSQPGVQTKSLPISNDTIIRWNKNRKLAWSDFKGKPPVQNSYAAASCIEIDWEVKKNVNGKIIFDVYAGFHVKSYTTTTSSACLEHEQLHFDLSEVYARMIRKYIDENFETVPATTDGGDMMNHYFKSLREMMKSEGARYDIETNHGLNGTKQAEWKLYIENKLKELEFYEF